METETHLDQDVDAERHRFCEKSTLSALLHLGLDGGFLITARIFFKHGWQIRFHAAFANPRSYKCLPFVIKHCAEASPAELHNFHRGQAF